MTINSKRFRDSRFGGVRPQVGVSGSKPLSFADRMHRAGLGHGDGRFERHDFGGQTPVSGSNPNLVQDRKSLLDGSAREHAVEKSGSDSNDTRTNFEKHMDKVKEAFKRRVY